MRLGFVVIAGSLLFADAAGAQTPPNCNGVNLDALKDYLEQSSSYLAKIAALEFKTNGKVTKLSDLLQTEITDQTRTSLELLQKCADVIVSKLDAILAGPKQPPKGFTIQAAWFGDHRLQTACWRARRAYLAGKLSGPAPKCDFICDASEAVRMACSKPIEGVSFVEKDSGTPVEPSTVKSGNKAVEVLGNSVICSISVGYGLCFNRDPSPDSSLKMLRLTYLCPNEATARTVRAADGAEVIFGCTKP